MAASAGKLDAEVRLLQDNIQCADDRITGELDAKSVAAELQIKDLQESLQKLEAQWPTAGMQDRKGKWSLSCPKDMQPTCRNGKKGWKKRR